MKRKLKQGSTSVIVPIRIDDTSSTTGAGLTGLTHASAGLVARYKRSDQSGWTTITLVAGTLGTWVSGGVVEAGRGVYELSLPNLVLSAGTWVIVQLYGATNMADVNLEIELDQLDYQDAAAAGLSRLDAAVSSRSSHAAADVWAVGSRTLTGFGTLVSDIAAAVWAAGTRTLTAIADSAGVATLLDRLSADRATKLDNLDVAVSSRLSTLGYTAPDNAGIATVAAGVAAVLEDTGTTIPAQISGLNNLSQAQAQTAAAAALTAYDPPTRAEATSDKDEIMTRLGAPAGASHAADLAAVKTDTGGLVTSLAALAAKFSGITSMAWWLRLLGRKDTADPTAKSEYNASGGSYDEATDSQQGQTDTGASGLTAAAVWAHPERALTQSAAQVEEILRGSTIVLTRGVRNGIALTGLGSLADVVELYFTVKEYPDTETDSQAILQVNLSDGLLRLNGEAGTAADASITVDDEDAGDITIVIDAEAAAELVPKTKLVYDVKAVFASGPALKTKGRCDISSDVTRAVS